ncbi:DUF429 domain-containing protein [Aquipuribacter sp. SD81]|uniref:DUF429 domain-containing protein n=1 Tax=Aquipuribacter sp. SD81 TaxID=3127703 RepID=UPI00301B5B81
MTDVRVAGVDGVRERWVAVVLDGVPGPGDDPGRPGGVEVSWRVGAAADVLGLTHEVSAVGVDVPVGLVPTGRRACEGEARRLLGRASSSVFDTAPQPAFGLARREGPRPGNRAAAEALARAAGGTGISTQAWMVAAKVLEVEAAVRTLGGTGERVVEVHPETGFAVLAWASGAAPPPSKRSAPGVAARVRLLAGGLPGLDVLDVLEALARVPVGGRAADRVPVDDALDALAAAWSAARHARGGARVLGAADAARAVWSDGAPAPGRAVLVV